MIFSIVVPAYNEEAAVSAILTRCLAAAGRLAAEPLGFSEVEVLLVNDGSTDRTEELARAVPGVRVVSHPANRGYGAAIKTGFAVARGSWLGFLDADGTCDPDFFKDLLELARRDGLDVALGSRMHPQSRMPAVRVAGNRLFRTLVNVIGGTAVTDVASGMRVLKREALEALYPLPDGMNFTPAMSVRALLDPALRIGEVPMPYEERVGRSKLSVLGDGGRFLRVILETAIAYRPFRFFAAAAALLALASAALLLLRLGAPTEPPVQFYLAYARIEEWMLFRLMLVTVLLAVAVFLLALGLLAQCLVGLVHREPDRFGPGTAGGRALAAFPYAGAASLALALWVNRRPLASYAATGEIPPEFWVFPVVGGLYALVGCELLAFSVAARIARLLWERENFRRDRLQDLGGGASSPSGSVAAPRA